MRKTGRRVRGGGGVTLVRPVLAGLVTLGLAVPVQAQRRGPPAQDAAAGLPGAAVLQGVLSRDEISDPSSGDSVLAGPQEGTGEMATPFTFRWGLQRPELVRYNRVEALSLGARAQLRPRTALGPLTVSLVARVGMADQAPNARLTVSRETLRRRWSVRGYHELAAVNEGASHLGAGNSLSGLFLGRDDGEYFRRTGGAVELRPPSSQRPTYVLTVFAEYHEAVATGTDFALGRLGTDGWRFRENLPADEGWEMGGEVRVSPWWGTDPRTVQGGVDLTLRAASGDFDYARASLAGRLTVPLPGDLGIGLEAGGGTSWGTPPAQRLWLLGGAGSLRGYAPRAREGTSYVLARGELARHFAFGAVSLFSDLGWAGDRDAFHTDDALISAGVSLSLVDGLIRVDGGWGLRAPRAFRLDLYLDGIL